MLLSPSPTNKDETAFNRALGTQLGVWEWYELPENKIQLARCTKTMEVGKMLLPPDAVLEGYDWAGLEDGAIVVDVGGGVGTQGKKISNAHPHLKIVVQDRASVVKAAEEVCITYTLSLSLLTLSSFGLTYLMPCRLAASCSKVHQLPCKLRCSLSEFLFSSK